MTNNVLEFPGPLRKQEAIDSVTEQGWETGVILTIGKNDTDIVVFGTPTSEELLWLSEQLRIKALYKDEDEIDNDDDEIP